MFLQPQEDQSEAVLKSLWVDVTWRCWDHFRRGCVAPPSGHSELFPTERKQALSFTFLAFLAACSLHLLVR